MKEFSIETKNYKTFRPEYPKELFEWIASQCKAHDHAWDCGAGSGQATKGLAPFFKHILATDINDEQIKTFHKLHNVEFKAMPAETDIGYKNHFDVITVACALHWFDQERFFQIAHESLKKSGLFIAWTYEWPWTGSESVDAILKDFKDHILIDYWRPESQFYLNHYKDIKLPFKSVKPPSISLELTSDIKGLVGFLSTWSSVRRFIEAEGIEAFTLVAQKLEEAWKNTSSNIPIKLPLYIKAGKKLSL